MAYYYDVEIRRKIEGVVYGDSGADEFLMDIDFVSGEYEYEGIKYIRGFDSWKPDLAFVHVSAHPRVNPTVIPGYKNPQQRTVYDFHPGQSYIVDVEWKKYRLHITYFRSSNDQIGNNPPFGEAPWGETLVIAPNNFVKPSQELETYITTFDYNDNETLEENELSYLMCDYTPDGWSTSQELFTKDYESNQEIEVEFLATNDKYLYLWSNFIPNTYWTSITTPNPTKHNYRFLGWYNDPTEGSKVADGGEEYYPTQSQVLYARWVEEGVLPSIDTFTANIVNGEIVCNITESTGDPTPTLYIDVSRTSGGTTYASFEVENGVNYTLPYDEPGTIWYIRARAVNTEGTVYGLDELGEIQEYNLQIPYNVTENYHQVANPTITASKIQLDGTCTLTFNWTNITTDVYDVQYDIAVTSSNPPITPINHNDKTSGYNYTFVGRRDAETVYFRLKCRLLNSFGEEVLSYLITSPNVELDIIDLDNLNYTYHTTSTYHSIEFILDSINKNNNKLANMLIKLVDSETSEVIYNKFIGDETPTIYSQDLDPIEEYLMDDLKADHTYTLTVSMTGLNPVDPSKIHTNQNVINVNTEDLDVYPISDEEVVITNTVGGKPTVTSDIQLSWSSPAEGDSDLVDYVVAYRKQGQTFTEVYLQEQSYTITSSALNLQNNDQVYVKIGARYRDWTQNYVIKWKELQPILLTETNYRYYISTYPTSEKSRRLIFRAFEDDILEELIRNVFINK